LHVQTYWFYLYLPCPYDNFHLWKHVCYPWVSWKTSHIHPFIQKRWKNSFLPFTSSPFNYTSGFLAYGAIAKPCPFSESIKMSFRSCEFSVYFKPILQNHVSMRNLEFAYTMHSACVWINHSRSTDSIFHVWKCLTFPSRLSSYILLKYVFSHFLCHNSFLRIPVSHKEVTPYVLRFSAAMSTAAYVCCTSQFIFMWLNSTWMFTISSFAHKDHLSS
jgi:hypothetical protein